MKDLALLKHGDNLNQREMKPLLQHTYDCDMVVFIVLCGSRLQSSYSVSTLLDKSCFFPGQGVIRIRNTTSQILYCLSSYVFAMTELLSQRFSHRMPNVNMNTSWSHVRR